MLVPLHCLMEACWTGLGRHPETIPISLQLTLFNHHIFQTWIRGFLTRCPPPSISEENHRGLAKQVLLAESTFLSSASKQWRRFKIHNLSVDLSIYQAFYWSNIRNAHPRSSHYTMAYHDLLQTFCDADDDDEKASSFLDPLVVMTMSQHTPTLSLVGEHSASAARRTGAVFQKQSVPQLIPDSSKWIWTLITLTVSCFSKIQIGFTLLVPAHPGSPRQRAVKRVCVFHHSGTFVKPGRAQKETEICR